MYLNEIGLIAIKVLFIVNIREDNKSGLFVATHNRIKSLAENYNLEIKVYSIAKYDNWVLKFINRDFSKKILKKSYAYEGITYNFLYYKDTLLKKIGRYLGVDSYLTKLISKVENIENYDLVSAHWGHPPGSLAYYIKKVKKIPFTLTLHGSDIHTRPHENKGYKKFIVRNLKSSDSLFFVSQRLKEEALKLGLLDDASKLFISRNAIDNKTFYKFPSNIVAAYKEKEGIKNSHIVGFVGELNKIKRADWLIDIFKEIQIKFNQRIMFIIIGDGPLRNRITKEVEIESIDIKILGRIDQKELCYYYNLMDCMILPSKNEGLGNVILEAQACGTPVVATNTGGIPEIIDNKNNLVENKDNSILKGFSNKVSNVLESKQRIKSESITWEEIVEKELQIFRKLIEDTK